MESIINLQKHSALTTVSDIKQICQPLLDHLNISYFNLIRQFNDYTRICLNTNSDWVEHFCDNKLYLSAPFEEYKFKHNPGCVMWSTLQDSVVYQQAHDYFNIDHGITIIEKQQDYTDFYHFGTCHELNATSQYYLNCLDALHAFIQYFKDKAGHLLQRSDILVFPEIDQLNIHTGTSLILDEQQKQQFYKNLRIDKYYLGSKFGNKYLTRRELAVAKCLLHSTSATEIAKSLNITARTVIAHINNMKDKLNCTKLPQLTYKLARSELAYLLDATFITE